MVFTVTCGAFYLGLGTSARRILQARPSAAQIISRISGIAMIMIGVSLLAERIIR